MQNAHKAPRVPNGIGSRSLLARLKHSPYPTSTGTWISVAANNAFFFFWRGG